MQLQERINAFVQLGQEMREITQNQRAHEDLFGQIYAHNKWFAPSDCADALNQWSGVLHQEQLSHWTSALSKTPKEPKTIALILAGNIPLVGFHDILSVLISGHKLLGKISSKDPILTRHIIDLLITLEPRFSAFVDWTDKPLKNFDAVIATGSNNSALYFDHYFGRYPHIIRKNRNSVAVLTGQETPEELNGLAADVFQYFGLGCRSVSKLYVPKDYDFQSFFKAAYAHKDHINHNKYMNNYDYNKAVYLMDQVPILDNEFLLLKEDQGLSSPIAVLFYEYYANASEAINKLSTMQEHIQCLVGKDLPIEHVAFGQTQRPTLADYADGINTLDFLEKL